MSCETACNIKITENLVLFGVDSTVITDKKIYLIFYWQSSTFIDVNLSNLYHWSLCSKNNLSEDISLKNITLKSRFKKMPLTYNHVTMALL